MSREDSRPSRRTEVLARSVYARKRALNQQALGLPGISRALEALTQPSLGLGLIIVIAFAVACVLLATWTRRQPLVEVGRVMNETRLVRVEQLVTRDEAQTESQRKAAKQSAPRVYVADTAEIDTLVASIANLPATLEGISELAQVEPEVREQFGLTPELFAGLRSSISEPRERDRWSRTSIELATQLRKRPILDAGAFQRGQQEGTHSFVRLVNPPDMSQGPQPDWRMGTGEEVMRSDILSIQNLPVLERAMHSVAREAGFAMPLRQVVVNRLLRTERPTFSLDAAATQAAQTEAADAVEPVMSRVPRGDVIFRRGERLTSDQRELFVSELQAFDASRSWLARWLSHTSMALAITGIVIAMTGYAALFAPRIRRKASRVLGAALLMLGALAASCIGSAAMPSLLLPAAVVPTMFVAVLMCIGYDRRAALAFGLLHGLLVCLCLRENIATLAICVTGVACVAATLREVRDRKSLVRTSVLSGLGLATAVLVFGVLSRPIDALAMEVLRELLVDAGLVAAGMLVVGGLTLFVLPQIERAFNVTTGLTLSELRDPRQPLLRELQLRAPGTYTHSLNVASIAENAAEAVGADSLLTYVGCLYHDVGKMNKPEYFVENQAMGINKHDKLSPAMSLLLVVGHVKDGVELAREFHLPQRIVHFIEAHHGTTLVEYFYHRATQRALEQASREDDEPGETLMPDEFAYRYPGPRPRTKEVAILMIADACESASRTMIEPSPSKIETLVREIADKRLRDGQFDDCQLTLQELATIVESVARTITSMYHGRVPYPTGRREELRPATSEPKPLPMAR